MKHFLAILFVLFFSAAHAQKYVGESQKEQPEPYCSGLFCAANGILFNMETEPNSNTVIGYFNILDWLEGRVAGLQVYPVRDGRIAYIRNMPATIYIDEMRIDASFLDALPVTDIAIVKVIKQAFGLGAPGGVIAIYTKRGGEDEEE